MSIRNMYTNNEYIIIIYKGLLKMVQTSDILFILTINIFFLINRHIIITF